MEPHTDDDRATYEPVGGSSNPFVATNRHKNSALLDRAARCFYFPLRMATSVRANRRLPDKPFSNQKFSNEECTTGGASDRVM